MGVAEVEGGYTSPIRASSWEWVKSPPPKMSVSSAVDQPFHHQGLLKVDFRSECDHQLSTRSHQIQVPVLTSFQRCAISSFEASCTVSIFRIELNSLGAGSVSPVE